MIAHIYKSLRKPDAYLYLRDKDAFTLVPDIVRNPLGILEFVMSLELSEGRTLARANAAVVRSNLVERGYYLQVPPSVMLPPGQTSVVFNISVIDEVEIDGPQFVTITATVTNWTPGIANITVDDNEPAQIDLLLNIAQARHYRPVHFTAVSSVAATI